MRSSLSTLCACLAVTGLALGCQGAGTAGGGSGTWTSIAQAPGAPGAADFTTPRSGTASIARAAADTPAPAPQPAAAPAPAAPEPEPEVPTPEVRRETPATVVTEEASDFTFRFSVGDEVDVRIWREEELSATHTVLHDGTISPPLLDPVRIEGLTIREVRSELIPRYKKYIKDPRISVRVVSVHSSRVFVLGEVRDPQAVVAAGRMSVLQAVSQAGGFDMDTADRTRVRIVRPVAGGRARVITVNADAVIAGRQRDVLMQPGDVVFVPTTGLGDWSRRLTQLFGPIGSMLGSVGSVATTIVAIDSLKD